MPNKMLWVKKDDESFWERAAKYAGGRGYDSLSDYVSTLVRNDIRAHELKSRKTEVSVADILREIGEMARKANDALVAQQESQ
jgi:hypothetical protein